MMYARSFHLGGYSTNSSPQLDCYDLLGDTDAKTEGILRARFEQAAGCSPCALILRNLDAFAQSTQAPEPGNGTLCVLK